MEKKPNHTFFWPDLLDFTRNLHAKSKIASGLPEKIYNIWSTHSKSLLFFPSQIFFWMLLLFDEIFSQVTQADLKTGWLFDHWIFRPVCYTFWKFKTCSFKKTASKINLPFQRILIFFLLLRPSKIKIKKLFWSLLWFSQCSQLWVFDSK